MARTLIVYSGRGGHVEQERVIVFAKEVQGALGLDLCILDETATVADLLTAIAVHAILARGVCEAAMLLPEWDDGAPKGELPGHLGGDRENQYRHEFAQFYQNAIRRESDRQWQPGAYETWLLREFCSDEDWALLTRKNQLPG